MGKAGRDAVAKLVTGPKGTAEDKLRLVLLWLLAYEGEQVEGHRGLGADALGHGEQVALDLVGGVVLANGPDEGATARIAAGERP